jgi:hypothetical protein
MRMGSDTDSIICVAATAKAPDVVEKYFINLEY